VDGRDGEIPRYLGKLLPEARLTVTEEVRR